MALSPASIVRLRAVAVFAIVGGTLGTAIGYLVSVTDYSNTWGTTLLGAGVGLSVSGWIGAFEELVVLRMSNRLRHGWLNAVRFSAYLGLIVSHLVVGAGFFFLRVEGYTVWKGMARYVTRESFPRDTVIAALTAVLLLVAMLLRRLHDPSELFALVTGRYHYPREERRSVLFADLVGSTAIAERLGPLRYSAFIRDCIADLSDGIIARRGYLYQHLGDGVVVTWPVRGAGQPARAVLCFFDMQDALAARRAYYRSTYGEEPRIRGGIHLGPVIATWVGVDRHELALHGDVLNTAARIESLCRTLGVDCLVSEEYATRCTIPDRFGVREAGEHELRGKAQPMRVVAVEPADSPGPGAARLPAVGT